MISKKDQKEMIREYTMPTLILALICLVVTFSLVTTYKGTEPIIKATAEKEAEKARTLVLPDSGGFELLTIGEAGSNILEVYKANNDSGFVITSIDKGYGGRIKVITGFSSDGLIKNVMLLEQKETPGLGTKVGEKEFTDQFTGVDNVDNVDTIAGATISSKALIRAVDTAIVEMKSIRGGEF